MMGHAVLSLGHLRAGRVWTLVTYAFSHQNAVHLGSNMLALYFFGSNVAAACGGGFLLALYFGAAVVAGAAHLGWSYLALVNGARAIGRPLHPSDYQYAPGALGASGSVNAIVVLGCCLFPTQTVLLYGIVPLPAVLFGAGYVLFDVAGVLGDGQRTSSGQNVGHAAHLGGALAGALTYWAYRRGRIRPSYRW